MKMRRLSFTENEFMEKSQIYTFINIIKMLSFSLKNTLYVLIFCMIQWSRSGEATRGGDRRKKIKGRI